MQCQATDASVNMLFLCHLVLLTVTVEYLIRYSISLQYLCVPFGLLNCTMNHILSVCFRTNPDISLSANTSRSFSKYIFCFLWLLVSHAVYCAIIIITVTFLGF